ncbi:MAG: glutamate-5-semialdehyde dehydrogenase [Elusimicrobia bacterium]|nr:glutamate-5-semialdehyde dehydrogenase [Elusimicrobiota bacterium]
MENNDKEKIKQKKIFDIASRAVLASRELRIISSDSKKNALIKIAELIDQKSEDIQFRNEIDVEAAKEDNLPAALIDRLLLDGKRIKSMTDGIREVAAMEDPVGEVLSHYTRPNGLVIDKVRVPLGVIAMIYESRPNVTGDSAALCLMSSNAVILRGGTEALNSNLAIGHYIREALKGTDIPQDAVQIIDDSDRNLINYLVSLKGMVDVVIPRGSEEMIETISRMSSVPVIGHGKGLCHIYIDSSADRKKAVEIVYNAKVQRPGVCNAVETLLVHTDAARSILPAVCEKLRSAQVELRGDEAAREICQMNEATEEDWSTEYLSLILSVKIVGSLEEAVEHIEKYGSRHSDCIIAEDREACDRFTDVVDSACVYCNASTRFTDGNQMGLGAEIGISNQKLHARGPMGLKELTSYKYLIRGNGQIRQ